MKWKSEWWGVTLIAENVEEEHLLHMLYEKLPKKIEPKYRYDDGLMEIKNDEDELELIFNR